jgi:hypothetical protein
MPNYSKQVDKKHYSFGKYYYPGRWISYWHETNEILKRDDIDSVLDVGPGSDLLKNILKTFKANLRYETLDIAADVQPDHVGGITAIPLPDNSFAGVCAFQVLEHIEFKDVPAALAELRRVSSKYVLVSVPHFGPSIEFQFKIPLIPRIRLATKMLWPKKHVFGGQHYWELGKKGYSPKFFRGLLQEHFEVIDEYVPFENQYHRFFILKVI